MDSNQIPENCPGVNSEQAGQGSACQGCPNQSICKSGKVGEQIQIEMKSVKHKIFVLSGKGGVGKSTVSAQLAHILASQGYEVGLMDIDICGPSIPRMMGLQGRDVSQTNEGWQPIYLKENLAVMSIGFLLENQDEAIIWRGPRKNGLIKQFLTDVQWGDLDYLIIDTPPGTSDEHISIMQFLKSTPNDGAVIVTTPQEVSLSDVRKEISFCQRTNTNILGIIENMSGFVCPNCNHQTDIFQPFTGGAQKMCENLGLRLLGQIPLEPKVLIATEKGQNILEIESQATQVFKKVVECKNNSNNI